MTDLAIYGAGGLGREIYCMIKNDRVASEKWHIIGFFDDNKEIGSCNVSIGSFNLLNNNVAFGHDCVVGNFNTFMPGVRISGDVSMGDSNYFGVA